MTNSFSIPDGFEIIEKKYGKFLFSKDGDLVENIIKTNDENYIWDYQIISEIEKYLNPNSIIADVGAYVGEQVVYLSKKAQHIHAFEPHPEKFKQLLTNVNLNNISNVSTYNVALSNTEGYCSLNSCPGNTADTKIQAGEDIKMIRLDDLNLNIDILKIDAQGHDYFVIEGALETIRKNSSIVIFEFETFSSKRMNDFYNLFHNLNYEIKSINQPPPQSSDHPNNYVAFPK